MRPIRVTLAGMLVAGGLLVWPTASVARSQPAFGFLEAEQNGYGVDIRLASIAGTLSVRGGGNIKKKGVPKLVRGATLPSDPDGSTFLRLKLTSMAMQKLKLKGVYKLVLVATLTPGNGSVQEKATRTVILRRDA